MINRIIKATKIRESGKYEYMPIHHYLPRFATLYPGHRRENNIIITAASGVGKSQFTRYLFINVPIDFAHKFPDAGIKPKIILHSLEESLRELEDKFLCNEVYLQFKKVIAPPKLQGIGEIPLNSHEISMLKKVEKDVQKKFDYLNIQTSIYHPTGIYNYCRDVSRTLGTHYYRKFRGLDIGKVLEYSAYKTLPKSNDEREPGEYRHNYCYDEYKLTDPATFVINIVDNTNLLKEEFDHKTKKMLSLRESMLRWSTNYGRQQLTKNWKWTNVDVQQQNSTSEKMQYTMKGQSVVEKLEPSKAELADATTTQRDSHVIFGLFAPNHYNIESYMGYDTERMGDNFRMVKILKNRNGIPRGKLPLYFNGAANYFEELPIEMTNDNYKQYNL